MKQSEPVGLAAVTIQAGAAGGAEARKPKELPKAASPVAATLSQWFARKSHTF